MYDISGIDFDRLRREFARSATKPRDLMALKDAVAEQLARMVAVNPLRVDFEARFRAIVDAYNHETDRVVIERTFDELLAFVKSSTEEARRAVREGLDDESLAIFDRLCRGHGALDARARERVKTVAVKPLGRVREEVAALHDWWSRPTIQARVRKFIYDYLSDDRTGLPAPQYGEANTRAATEGVFLHLFQRYGGGAAYAAGYAPPNS